MTPPLFEVVELDERCGNNPLALSIAPGGYLGVIGPNGAGKNTAIRMCPGLNQHPKRLVPAKGYDFFTR